MNDQEGLVMADITVPDPAANLPNSRRDSSAWKQLVWHELYGGLSGQVSYRRGTTRKKELPLKKIVPSSSYLSCSQLLFWDNKTDSIRRVTVLPRSWSSGRGGAKKTLCPPEIGYGCEPENVAGDKPPAEPPPLWVSWVQPD
jgi:hypothetical protein